jgi:hypothetical protein
MARTIGVNGCWSHDCDPTKEQAQWYAWEPDHRSLTSIAAKMQASAEHDPVVRHRKELLGWYGTVQIQG